MSNNSEDITYEDLENLDVISVELVPERKGLILKHCEYFVSSRRHGTTVNRRYNDFVQLHDVLIAKYPYRAISRLPPKRVNVGGGSPTFLQRRRAALQRWLTLVARHPVLAHDADLRVFLCESTMKLDKPKHDEFMLAGTQDCVAGGLSTEELQAHFLSEQEQLRVMQLGLARFYKIFERVESRTELERADLRELGAGLSALSATAASHHMRTALGNAAKLATSIEQVEPTELYEEESVGRLLIALDSLCGFRDLCTRLSRGLHGERAAAAAAATAAAGVLRDRHRYSLACLRHEARVGRAYALSALGCLAELFSREGAARTHLAHIWHSLRNSLDTQHLGNR